jgi:hypothetical protein
VRLSLKKNYVWCSVADGKKKVEDRNENKKKKGKCGV